MGWNPRWQGKKGLGVALCGWERRGQCEVCRTWAQSESGKELISSPWRMKGQEMLSRVHWIRLREISSHAVARLGDQLTSFLLIFPLGGSALSEIDQNPRSIFIWEAAASRASDLSPASWALMSCILLNAPSLTKPVFTWHGLKGAHSKRFSSFQTYFWNNSEWAVSAAWWGMLRARGTPLLSIHVGNGKRDFEVVFVWCHYFFLIFFCTIRGIGNSYL